MKNIKGKFTEKYLFNLMHLKNKFWKGFCNYYYSQSGEDIILGKIFSKKKNGFYVDVGAYHPKHYSNTYLLREKGWKGINIDPNPKSIKLFKKYRKSDINLQIGILKEGREADYYVFNHQSCNTFSEEQKNEMEKKSFIKLLEKRKILCLPMKEVLEKYLPTNQNIDLLNVDAEGLDLDVLETNDWDRFRPFAVVVERPDTNLGEIKNDAIYSFLNSRSYELYAATGLSMIFLDKEKIKGNFRNND